ncbi:MAG: putative membrane protein [Oleiphilaceae bacterium]|jgi:uncharacterized membrane protein
MLYLSALTLFFIMHIIPFKPHIRKTLTNRIGEKPYKILFRIIVFGIVCLGIVGWTQFENIYFYEPGLLLKRIHLALMFPAVYLWVIAETSNNLKRFIRHPMLTGTKIWALGAFTGQWRFTIHDSLCWHIDICYPCGNRQ